MAKKYELEVFQGLSESEIKIVQKPGNQLITGKEDSDYLIKLMEVLVEVYKKGRIMGMVKTQAHAVLKESRDAE